MLEEEGGIQLRAGRHQCLADGSSHLIVLRGKIARRAAHRVLFEGLSPIRGFGARALKLAPCQSNLFQLNLRLHGPDDPFEGSFGQLIVCIPFHGPIRLTFEFPERGDVVGAAGT